MAFPTIPTVAAGRVLSNVQADTTATRTFPSLTGLTKNSGDLLIAICVAYQTSTGTDAAYSGWTGGFTEFHDSATSTTMAIGMAYKFSDGTETGTIAVTQAATITGHAGMILLSISGAHASTPPEAGSRASGTSAAADPGTFDPSGWAAEDTLWIAIGGSGETSTTATYTGIASAPASFSDYVDTGISADAVGGVEGAVAFRQLNASSLDVGTFSVDITNARNAAVVGAVRPAAVVDHALAFDFPLALTQGTALQPTEHPVSFGLPLDLQIDSNLQPTEHPVAFDDPLDLTVDTNLTRETSAAFDLPLGLTQDTNLVTTVEHALAFDMSLGLTEDSSLTAEFLLAFTDALGLQIDSELAHEAFLASALELGLQIDEGLLLETSAAFDLPLGLIQDFDLTGVEPDPCTYGSGIYGEGFYGFGSCSPPVGGAGGSEIRRSRRRRSRQELEEEELLFILSQL